MKKCILVTALLFCVSIFAAPINSMLGAAEVECYDDMLPPGARWVEYLESDMTRQFIDTGIRLPQSPFTFYYRTKVNFTNFNLYNGYCTWGGGNNGYTATISSGNGTLQDSTFSFNLDTWYDALFTNNYGENRYCYVDGSLQQSRAAYQISSYPPTFGIFCSIFGQNGGIFSYSCCKIKSVDMGFTKNGVTSEYKFRPIAIGDKGYMLDLISGEIYGNAGEGEFIIGPDL